MKRYRNRQMPHMRQYLLNFAGRSIANPPQHQRDADLPTARADSRVTAVIGTRHSEHAEVGRLLHDTWSQHQIMQAEITPSSADDPQHIFGPTPGPTSSPDHFAGPIDQSSTIRSIIDDAYEVERRTARPISYTNLLDKVMSYANREGQASSSVTSAEHHAADQIRKALQVDHQSLGQSDSQTASEIRSDVDNSTDTSGIIQSDADLELIFEDTINEILRYGRYLIESGDASQKTHNSKTNWRSQVIQDIDDIVVIDRSALDNRKTFWNSAITGLATDMGLLERIDNFVWRNGRVVMEFVVNILARIPIFSISDAISGDTHTVRLFLRNIARKRQRRRARLNRQTGNAQTRYILVWVNRDSGWNQNPIRESPLFEALVTHLGNEGYLRSIEYGGKFHLVIEGRGDTRYILDEMGLDSSGTNFRMQFLDSRGGTRTAVRTLLEQHVARLARMVYSNPLDGFTAQPPRYSHKQQRKIVDWYRTESLVHPISQRLTWKDRDNEEQAALAAFDDYIHNNVTQDLEYAAKHVMDVTFDFAFKPGRRPVLGAGSVANNFAPLMSLCSSIRNFVFAIVVDDESSLIQRRLDDWCHLGQIRILGDVIEKTMIWSIRHCLESEYKTRYRRHVDDIIEGSSHEPVAPTSDSDTFDRMILAQLEPIDSLLVDDILSDLEQVSCTNVACAVAQIVAQRHDAIAALKNKVPHLSIKPTIDTIVSGILSAVLTAEDNETRLEILNEVSRSVLFEALSEQRDGKYIAGNPLSSESIGIQFVVTTALSTSIIQRFLRNTLNSCTSALKQVQPLAEDYSFDRAIRTELEEVGFQDAWRSSIASTISEVHRSADTISSLDLRRAVLISSQSQQRTADVDDKKNYRARSDVRASDSSRDTIDRTIAKLLAVDALETVYTPANSTHGERDEEVYIGRHYRFKVPGLQQRLLMLCKH